MTWQTDPRWRLIDYEPAFWQEEPTDRPSPSAEVSADGYWASVYDGRRPVATWARTGVLPPSEPPATIAVSEP